MSSKKRYGRKTRNLLLLQVYAKYKREFLNPGVNKQEVWEKIANKMKEKGSFNYDALQWRKKVAQMRKKYEKTKYIPVTSGELVDFKFAAKNAFEVIKNPVPVDDPVPEASSVLPWKKYDRKIESVVLLEVYAKYKRALLNPRVNKQEIWKKISYKMKEKGSVNYDISHLYRKVEELRKCYERIKYIPATDKEMIEFKIAANNAFRDIENPVNVLPSKVKMALKQSRKGCMDKEFLKGRLFRRDIALLTVYRLHKKEFTFHVNAESIWKKISEKMNKEFPDLTLRPVQCRDKVIFMKKQYERQRNKNSEEVTSTKDVIFMKVAKLAFKTKENPVTFMDDQKRQKQLAPLKAFNMYKAQFLSPDANHEELWQKITETANKLASRTKTYSVENFRNHLRALKYKYDLFKNSKKAINTPEETIFFEEAKLVFESTGSEAISVDQIIHDTHLEKVRQKFERYLALLRAYNIYKAEFSSPNEDDESVWDKIAGTVRISCSLTYWSTTNCRLQFSQLKEKYQKKKQQWYINCQPDADIYLEEEKLAFEKIGYPEEHELMDLLTEISTDSV